MTSPTDNWSSFMTHTPPQRLCLRCFQFMSTCYLEESVVHAFTWTPNMKEQDDMDIEDDACEIIKKTIATCINRDACDIRLNQGSYNTQPDLTKGKRTT